MRGVETMAEGLVTSQRLGLEVILQILRLEGHFCGDHGASAPPPSCRLKSKLKELRGLKVVLVISLKLDLNSPSVKFTV